MHSFPITLRVPVFFAAFVARILFLTCVAGMCRIPCGADGLDGVDSGNRLTYLDASDPFHVNRLSPRLTTPQWIGAGDADREVEAVVTLGIDDMRGNVGHYEAFLRPVIDRLKAIDGRGPVSILCNAVDPDDPGLPGLLREGLSVEVHTLSHPCPLLARHRFDPASDTFHGGVDLLNHIPGNRPVAFRTPCCDSQNTPSPRMFAEIFNRTNDAGQFLEADSSVFNVMTPADPELPREWVLDAKGNSRFEKYIPFPSYVVTIADYPYPYVINRLCWEFPCTVPSDWEAQNLHGNKNPETVEDWKRALDAIVLKRGNFNFVFHPHGWVGADQMVEFVDYADSTYGRRVRFLTFPEAVGRLTRNLLAGQPLRNARGGDNGVRLIDLNMDGFMDVVIGNDAVRMTRLWDPESRSWRDSDFPVRIVAGTGDGGSEDKGVHFGVLRASGFASFFVRNERDDGVWHFDGDVWVKDPGMRLPDTVDESPLLTSHQGRDRGFRFRDLNRDGRCEAIVSRPEQNAVFSWDPSRKGWVRWRRSLPAPATIVDSGGGDNGVRFVDLNADTHADLVWSNPDGYLAALFAMDDDSDDDAGGGEGHWDAILRRGDRREPAAVQIPMIVRDGPHRNNGAWFHSDHLWIQNEDTSGLPDLVDRRSFADLLNTNADIRIIEHPRPQSAVAGSRARFNIEAAVTGAGDSPIVYRWLRNGTPIPGAGTAEFVTDDLRLKNNRDRFACEVFVAGIRRRSDEGVLTVHPDTEAPQVLGATALRGGRSVTIRFSEVMDPAAVEANADADAEPAFQLLPGPAIRGVQWMRDRRSLSLHLAEPLPPDLDAMRVRVREFTDLAGNAGRSVVVPVVVETIEGRDVGFPGDPVEIGRSESLGSGDYIVTAGGSDIWGHADHFHFLHHARTGDFDVRVRLESFVGGSYYAKAGLMIRESLEPGSRTLSVFGYPTRGVWASCLRNRTGDGTFDYADPVDWAERMIDYPDAWIRMKRAGNRIHTFWSGDGTRWNPIANYAPLEPFPETVFVGLATCSQDNRPGATATAHYRDFGETP